MKNKRHIHMLLVGLFSLQIVSSASDMTIDNVGENKSSNEITAAKSCPMCSLSEMPMEVADKINEISDVDVFLHDFVDTSNSLSNVTSLYSHPSNRKKRAAARSKFSQARCQPIDTLVSLVPKNERDPTIFYMPTCVIVKQCGGCCAHSGTACTPLEETETQVTVQKTQFAGGSKFVSLDSIVVTVKEHSRCKCQCKITDSDCNADRQIFDPSQCSCKCKNQKEAVDCAQNPMKLFDTKSCACVCRDTKNCIDGFVYDQESCSCKENPESTEEEYPIEFGEHSFINETFEATDDNKYETENLTTASDQ